MIMYESIPSYTASLINSLSNETDNILKDRRGIDGN